MIKKERSKAEKLAEDVLALSKNSLLVQLRYLDMALSRLSYYPIKEECIMTEGRLILYDARYVLETFAHSKETMTRNYLHMLMHCVYHHMFVNPTIDRPLWDLATDIAVENVISEIGISSVAAARETQQTQFFQQLIKDNVPLTAERIYQYLKSHEMSHDRAAMVRACFYADNHEIWYMTAEERLQRFGICYSDGKDEKDVAQDWKNVSERMQVDMEHFQKEKFGHMPGNMVLNLNEVNREKYDYTAFLKKFAVLGEVMKLNPDEFDYVYYTYGLSLYDNMPLIEPLEYKDEKRIKEFVIVIDSSGSTMMNTKGLTERIVGLFLRKTYNILKSEESFFSKINIHIIQCDAKVQEDMKITSQEEFEKYLENMKILGGGGSDFRPPFAYVDELIEKKEFKNLKGLIYFTDGWGTFPSQKPAYETAFAFLEEEDNNYGDVPPWAIKLILREEDMI